MQYGVSFKWRVFAFTISTGVAKTGDAANIDAEISKNGGAFAAVDDAAPDEVLDDAAAGHGYYEFTITATEAQGTTLELMAWSATADTAVVACPFRIDLGVQVLGILSTILDETGGGYLAAGFKKLFDVATPVLTAASVNQTGDSYGIVTNATYGNAAIRTQGDSAWITATGFATPTNITAGTITTVTNLTNLPAVTTDWLTAAGVKADAVTKIQSGLATPTNITAASGVSLAASQHVIVDSGTVTTLTNAPTGMALEATLTAIKGATWSASTDTLEAIRDRGDAAWITATGFATPTNITGGTITTVTNLTNLPTMPADWLTASGLKADAVTEIQGGLATSTAMTAAFTEIKGATWSASTDTLEAIRNATTGTGAGLPTATITVKDTNGAGAAVSGVVVYVYDSTNTTMLARGTTNGSGIAAIIVPGDATYKVRLFKSAYTQSTNPNTIAVSGDTAAEFYMTAFSVGTPSPSAVRIYSWEFKSDGVTPAASAAVAAWPSDRGAHHDDGGIAYGETNTTLKATATTDANGYWYLDLYPGVEYDFDLSATRDKIYEEITTPAANGQLEDLI